MAHKMMIALEAMLASVRGVFFVNATGGKKGYGILLKRGDSASPEVFTTIAEARSIGELGSERGLIDMTNMDSPDEFMEYILSMKDGVEFTLQCNFLPANATQGYATGVIDDHNDGTRRNYRVDMTVHTFGIFQFPALTRVWKTSSIEPNTAVLVNFTFKVTGPITWVAA